MLVISSANLVFLAVPKTGTTAIEMALRPHADIAFMKRRKHMPAHRYRNKMAPFLQENYSISPETVAVMRNPLEQIRSWYRYRRREERRDDEASAQDLTFDQFAQMVISKDPPRVAGIGSQYNFLTGDGGAILVDHLFAYEAQPQLRDFLEAKIGKSLEIKQRNVSPPAPTPIRPETEAALRKARAPEFALHARLTQAGGYLAG